MFNNIIWDMKFKINETINKETGKIKKNARIIHRGQDESTF